MTLLAVAIIREYRRLRGLHDPSPYTRLEALARAVADIERDRRRP